MPEVETGSGGSTRLFASHITTGERGGGGGSLPPRPLFHLFPWSFKNAAWTQQILHDLLELCL